MPRTKRQYGKQTRRTKAERLFAELPQTPVRKQIVLQPVDKSEKEDNDSDSDSDQVHNLTLQLSEVQIEESKMPGRITESPPKDLEGVSPDEPQDEATPGLEKIGFFPLEIMSDGELIEVAMKTYLQASYVPQETGSIGPEGALGAEVAAEEADGDLSFASSSVLSPPPEEPPMRTLTWAAVCSPDDSITKIAEASFAEVYRVTNSRGVSIMKVIRLQSPIKDKTKAQVKSGLVDEEPHNEQDIDGELRISEWLAEIPGFVVYKDRYIVKGKTTPALLETHQNFQKKLKKEDPGRAQFYPSPSRYLDDTRFMVVELGDAGTSLEDWPLQSGKQLWDIFLLVAIALARAEELAKFEHRDLHEGNLCIKQVRKQRQGNPGITEYFGNSGLDITILDYGLSRAQDTARSDAEPVAFDLETDLSIFTSTHAAHCEVYRQMRSYLLRGNRECLPPEAHNAPYEAGVDGPIDWKVYRPHTNVLWLAYIYKYMVEHFKGHRRELLGFQKVTRLLWSHLNPQAPRDMPMFESATAVIAYALTEEWITEDQLRGASEASMLRDENSIILLHGTLDEAA